jgi:hypothetical protein
VLQVEAEAVLALSERLDERFERAVEMVLACEGRVVITGMGKSGLICQKIASTMASTGTPALFLHPAEGIHGDLGMLMRGDVVIAISNSGETEEITRILPVIKRMGLPLISMTGNARSSLGRAGDVDAGYFHQGGGLPARDWHPPPAPRRRWPWVTLWRSLCWSGADFAKRTSPCSIRGEPWARNCCCAWRT